MNRIFFLINPAAGGEDPVRQQIREVFDNNGQQISIHELTENENPAAIVKTAAANHDLIVVCGGDGSITQAAAGLLCSTVPLAIIPGGTANVLSKELGLPQDTTAALTLIRDHQFQLRKMDTGLVNGEPFLLRVNLGIMADMILKTDPALKDKIGQLAYGVATFKSLQEAEQVSYRLNLDGRGLNVSGVSLTVTNSGNMGIGDLQLQPGISISDGLLDVVLLKDAGIVSILKAAGGSLLGKETDAVEHWTCKEINIRLPRPQTYLCDDCEAEASEIGISIVPASLTIAVPLTEK